MSAKMENKIERYAEPEALWQKDSSDNSGAHQRPYIYVRWGDEPYVVDGLEMQIDRSSTPMSVYNGTASWYLIPNIPDATLLRDEIEEKVVPILERMNENTEIYWDDRSNMCGRDIDVDLAQDLDQQLGEALEKIAEFDDFDGVRIKEMQTWDCGNIYDLWALISDLEYASDLGDIGIPVAEEYRVRIQALWDAGNGVLTCDSVGQCLDEHLDIVDIEGLEGSAGEE